MYMFVKLFFLPVWTSSGLRMAGDKDIPGCRTTITNTVVYLCVLGKQLCDGALRHVFD